LRNAQSVRIAQFRADLLAAALPLQSTRLHLSHDAELMMQRTDKQQWVLTFTRSGESGREVGKYGSRDDAMIAAQTHFDRLLEEAHREDEELGWQMSFASATAVCSIGAYRVIRADLRNR
jgi:hypothetical protein